MNLFISIVIVATLALICWQDFSNRAISWWLIPLGLVSFSLHSLLFITWAQFWKNSLANLGFVCLQLLLLTAYFWIKHKRRTSIVNTQLGIGDILFFVCCCTAFSTLSFVFFYVAGLILSLIGFIVYQLIAKSKMQDLPLAGSMALLFVIRIMTGWLSDSPNFYESQLFHSFISH